MTTPSPQSPPEPGRGDMLARQERMAAELEQEIALCGETIDFEGASAETVEAAKAERSRLRSELSRLRNEGGGGECPCCGGSGYERYLGRDNSEEVIDCSLCKPAASPSDLPAREAVERGDRPIPFDRDTAGRFVREAWVRWAKAQPDPKPSWLVPYDELSEPDKEADRQIGETVARWTLIYDAACAALQPLSQGNGVGTDHKSIWLSPVCDREHCDNCRDDQTWHEDRLPICDECGAEPTQYIRADLYTAPPSQSEGVREALEAIERGITAVRLDAALNEQPISPDVFEQFHKDILAAIKLTTTPSLGLVEAAEWQSIETAPHGELLLLGWYDTGGIWQAETACASQGTRTREYSNVSRHSWATHWMPLPAPPRTSAKGGAG